MSNFPVSVANDITANNILAMGRSRLQLNSASNWVVTPATVTAGAQVSAGIGFFVRPGKKFIMQSLVLTANGECQIIALISPDAANNWYPWVTPYEPNPNNLFGINRFYATFGPNGGSVSIPMGAGYEMYENMSFGLSYISPTTTGKNVAFTAMGLEVPNEPNMNATYKIVVEGDSTAWGANLGNDSQGRLFLGSSQWSEVFRDNARNAGIDAQIFANNAQDGKTMLEGYYMLEQGLNKIPFDLKFVCYGMNDATSLKYPTEAKFKESVLAHILKRNRFNKGKPIVFMAPVNTDDLDRTAGNRITNIRQWISDVATDPDLAGSDNNVYYVDQSLIFPLNPVQADDINYKSSERVTGQIRVHPSGIGSTLIGNYMWENLKTSLFGL